MYLVELDEDTGLVKDDINNDGWKAITEFRTVFKEHGLKGFTLVALSCDYLTPFSMYNDEERPFRAMQELYESRLIFDVREDIWREAFVKYKSLQRNNDLEFDRLNRNYETNLLEKLSSITEQVEVDQLEFERTHDLINKHKERMDKFEKKFNKAEIVKEHGVASNGYKMSRIEQDIAFARNSKFVNTEKKLENPNKLGLNNGI